jgi:hypothetical protein
VSGIRRSSRTCGDCFGLFREDISAITVLEFKIGVRRKERADAEQGALVRQWLDRSIPPNPGAWLTRPPTCRRLSTRLVMRSSRYATRPFYGG